MQKELIWDDATIARYWRWQAQYPEQYFTYRFGERIARGLRRHIQKGHRVLDYGCGMGFLSGHLTRYGASVWATDLSSQAVEATNARNREIAGFHGARALDKTVEARERFDRILSIEVIEHLDDEKLSEFFSQLYQLLAPDGLVVITTPNREDLAASEIYCPCCDQVFHRWQHLRTFSEVTLSTMVRDHGFEVMEVYTTNFALGRLQAPWASVKRQLKAILGRDTKLPHLVCVARRNQT